ncbi:MAG TPA: hypothetical protein VI874_00910 [Candidatus Norongarragalinales archaeon]|nr:hypothetical protein [Candidatus Norongarragalinales archaeon]
MRIGIVGPKKAGKSLLAFKLVRFLAQKGQKARLANFDTKLTHASFKPDFDLRQAYRSVPEDAYPKAFRDDVVKKATDAGVWVVDFASGLDWLLFSNTVGVFCDVFLLTVDDAKPLFAELARFLSSAHGVPFILVVNRPDALVSSQKTLSPFFMPKGKGFESAVLVNAKEREGFDTLWETIQAVGPKG